MQVGTGRWCIVAVSFSRPPRIKRLRPGHHPRCAVGRQVRRRLVHQHDEVVAEADQMIRHYAGQLVKPEQRQLARNRLPRGHVKRTDAVRRHHQDAIRTHSIVVANFAAREEREGVDLAGVDGVHG